MDRKKRCVLQWMNDEKELPFSKESTNLKIIEETLESKGANESR
jgi:hypothetical protein